MEWLNKVGEGIIAYLNGAGMRLVVAATVLLAGLAVVKIGIRLLRTALFRSPLENSLVTFFLSVLSFLLYTVLVMTVAGVAGISLTSFVAIFTALGLAVSLALQSSLGNVANGVVILSTKPFQEGDFIEVDGVSGKVKAIRMLNTRLVTPDNKVVTIPNTQIVNSNVVNYTTSSTRRLDLTFSVSYDSDVARVREVLLGLAEAYPSTLKTPAPLVRLGELSDSSLKFYLRVWVPSPDYWDAFYDLTEQAFAAFRKEGIEVPYNRLDVRLKGACGAAEGVK